MSITVEDIARLIRQSAPVMTNINDKTHIFHDIGFDSMLFMSLIQRLEEEYNIYFTITELEQCLIVGSLAEIAAEKYYSRNDDYNLD